MQRIKSFFNNLISGSQHDDSTIMYPLIDRSFDYFDIKFKNVHKVIKEKGYTVTTDNSITTVLNEYEKKDNEPTILTMIVKTKPEFETDLSFDDKNGAVCIDVKKNKKACKNPQFIDTKEIKMVDITKYTFFYINEK